MAEHGAGFDVTSRRRTVPRLQAGSTGAKIVFAGVGKTDAEMQYGLENGVFLFNVESEEELHALGGRREVARASSAPVALRVNPDLPPKTHAKTDTTVKGVKFGLDIETVARRRPRRRRPPAPVGRRAAHAPRLRRSSRPSRTAQGRAKAVHAHRALREQGHTIQYLNMGGGFGIHYRKQEALPAAAFAEVILPAVKRDGLPARPGAGPVHRRQRRHPGQPGDLSPRSPAASTTSSRTRR